MPVVQLRLPQELFDRATQIAEDEGGSLSHVLRRAIKRGIEKD